MSARPNHANALALLSRHIETIGDVADDFRDLYVHLPNETPRLSELLDLLARLEFATRYAAASIEEMRGGHACH
ncbi:MAG: hypothetical protein M0P95_07170 [Sulfuritalea sp.]|jgi:hypothetical protein|nr:hypothetical protein [Sulfuritalea sp.]